MSSGEGASYCASCHHIASHEARDEFDGELFCPVCLTRVDKDNRGPSVAALRKRFPKASIYTEPETSDLFATG